MLDDVDDSICEYYSNVTDIFAKNVFTSSWKLRVDSKLGSY